MNAIPGSQLSPTRWQPIPRSHLNPWLLVLFAFLTATIATSWGYTFGTANQVEQLPIVLRVLDAGYLTNDFFVNAGSQYGPRLYFAQFTASLAKEIPLPAVYFSLTLISNILIALISGFFAREMFDRSIEAAMIAIVMVMSVKTFWLGDSNTVFSTFLEPSQLIMPLLLAAVWMGIKRRPIGMTVAAGFASLIHPLLGLEVGALMLGLILLQALLRAPYPVNFPNKRSYYLAILISLVIYLVFAVITLFPYLREAQIPAEQFVYILAHLRHPHHYLPSTFGLWQYLQAGAFLLAAGTAWLMCQSSYHTLRMVNLSLMILAATLVILCVCGYVFVEIVPTRIFTTLQVYRLLFLIKWLGLIMLAGWISRVFHQRFAWMNLFENIILFLSMMTPPTMVVTILFPAFRERLRREQPFLSGFLERGFIPALVIIGCILYGIDSRVYVLYPLFLFMAAYLIQFKRTWLTIPASLLLSSLTLLIIYQGNLFLPPSIMAKVDQPILRLEDIKTDHDDLADYVRQNTPKDAVFLTPPKLGEFRLTAERAIVVDFTAFPFQDWAMLEWYNRMINCYGTPQLKGWDAAAEMMTNYRSISDTQLLNLQDRYRFDYAILYPETDTAFPVLFECANYKLVQVLK